MIRVTKASFFAAIYDLKLNVHPHIVGAWDAARCGYRSDWEMQDGSRRRMGMSHGGGDNGGWFVEPDFYRANSAKLTAISA